MEPQHPPPATTGPRQADWLTVHDALERILSAVRPLSSERVPLVDAFGRTLAEPIHSPIDQPPWDNSAMDGFAARSADVRGACPDKPVVLRVIEEVPAGAFPTRRIGPGEAVKVMTGAPVPDGADCVIRIEHTSAWGGAPGTAARNDAQRPATTENDAQPGAGTGRDSQSARATNYDAARSMAPPPGQVAIFRDRDAGGNIRPRGEDMREGALVLEAGRVLRSAEMGVLATVGRAEVAVYRPPRVAILSNGDELADLDEFEHVRAGRKIVNSNSYALAGAVRSAGGLPILLGIAHDDEASIRAHLEGAPDADVLVTTAGASVGEHDLMKDVLERMGFGLDFWRVKMKPGSPTSFGRLGGETTLRELSAAPALASQVEPGQATHDRRATAPPKAEAPGASKRTGSEGSASSSGLSTPGLPVFGLPGNPVSALVAFEVLVRPALRRLQGRQAVYTPTLRVRTDEQMPSRPGLTHFLRVALRPGDDGIPLARRTQPQGSAILTSMANADALLIVPEESDGLDEGALALAIPLNAPDEARGG